MGVFLKAEIVKTDQLLQFVKSCRVQILSLREKGVQKESDFFPNSILIFIENDTEMNRCISHMCNVHVFLAHKKRFGGGG